MKDFLYILLFIGLSAALETVAAQQARFTSSGSEELSEVPRRLDRKYRRDAARLVLRMQSKEEDLRYQSIRIRKDQINSIHEVLTNIYLKNEQARGLAKCNIHTRPNPAIDHLIVIFDRSVDWAEPLRDGISETDSPEINALLDEYNLLIDKHVQWNDNQDAITIRSKEPLNMAALANEFYNIEGVDEIDPGSPDLKGNDIQLSRISGGWEVSFILRFGSYIDSEGQMHQWKYEVSDGGDVDFISEDGAPVPEWMKCSLREKLTVRL